jgi:hypothetical protein
MADGPRFFTASTAKRSHGGHRGGRAGGGGRPFHLLPIAWGGGATRKRRDGGGGGAGEGFGLSSRKSRQRLSGTVLLWLWASRKTERLSGRRADGAGRLPDNRTSDFREGWSAGTAVPDRPCGASGMTKGAGSLLRCSLKLVPQGFEAALHHPDADDPVDHQQEGACDLVEGRRLRNDGCQPNAAFAASSASAMAVLRRSGAMMRT